MLKHIKDFIIRFKDTNFMVVFIELILFSVIFGALPHLWPVACLMFVGLSCILSKPKGVLYMIYILSSGWALITMLIAFCFSGWGWALAWGIFTLISSLGIHFRDLKQPLYILPESDNSPELSQNLPFGRFNLN